MQRLSTTAMLAVLSSIGIQAHAQDVAWAPPVATDYVVKQIPGMHYVYGINDSGVAVGGAEANSVAVAFANGQLIRLPATGYTRTLAYAISNSGSIAGFGSTATSSYGLFWPSLASEPIRITGPNGATMRPVAVNSQGVVVGWSGDGPRAARWTAATGMTFMDPLGSTGATLRDMSETGYVAGTINFGETTAAMGRWNPNGTSGVIDWNAFAWRVRDDGGVIGTGEGGASYLWSVSNTRTPLAYYIVRDMSATGRMVGKDSSVGAVTQATPNSPVQALPRLPNGGAGFAIDVNACGTVVGMMAPPNDSERPVMWSRAPCDVQTTASVPDVRALTLDQAALTLKASNVFAGRTNYIVGPCPDVNRIVGQSPAAGAQAPTASSIELTVVVSCTVSVPDLRGQTVNGASATLRDAHLVLGTVRNATDTSCNNIGTVMNHSPTAGAQTTWGAAVNVTVGQRPRTPCP